MDKKRATALNPACETRTVVREVHGAHTWEIHNWKSWVACSERDASLYSAKFSVGPVINDKGEEENTSWMIKAFPRKSNGEDMLAFRLISLNKDTPKGTFQFKTIHRTKLWGRVGEATVSKFKPLPLDAASHWVTCIRYHTSETLTMRVKVRIVNSSATSPPLPLPLLALVAPSVASGDGVAAAADAGHTKKVRTKQS